MSSPACFDVDLHRGGSAVRYVCAVPITLGIGRGNAQRGAANREQAIWDYVVRLDPPPAGDWNGMEIVVGPHRFGVAAAAEAASRLGHEIYAAAQTDRGTPFTRAELAAFLDGTRARA